MKTSSQVIRAKISKLNLEWRTANARGERYKAQRIEAKIRELLIQDRLIKR